MYFLFVNCNWQLNLKGFRMEVEMSKIRANCHINGTFYADAGLVRDQLLIIWRGTMRISMNILSSPVQIAHWPTGKVLRRIRTIFFQHAPPQMTNGRALTRSWKY